MSSSTTTPAPAERFRAQHAPGTCLVLPNVWDAASAVLAQAAGATALATTSGGVAWAHGRADGGGLTAAEAVEAVRRIARAVSVPVTADLEDGYGATPEDVAATVRAVAEAGVAGINLEDSPGSAGPLRPPAEQAARIAAARAAVPGLFLNARTDVYLAGVGDPEHRIDLTLERAAAYADAGADLLFVPGLLDLAELTRLVEISPLGINAMALPGGPGIADLRATGVRRVSTGTALAQAAYGLVTAATTELLEQGTYDRLTDGADYGRLNRLLTD